MDVYVGLDVSLKETSICVVDGSGKIASEGTVLSEPLAIAEFLKAKAGSAKRIGLETGPILAQGVGGSSLLCIHCTQAKVGFAVKPVQEQSALKHLFGLFGFASSGVAPGPPV